MEVLAFVNHCVTLVLYQQYLVGIRPSFFIAYKIVNALRLSS